MKGMIHTATLRGKRQNFTLGYDAGTAVFTAGKILTGTTSHATAIIISTGAVGSGTLTLHTITGTFLNDETISDNNTVPGAALVNGTIADALDTYGNLTFTDIDTTVAACKFYKKTVAAKSSGQSLYVESTNRLMIPATVTPAKGDQVITTTVGFSGTWNIVSPNLLPGPGGVAHHWECDLAMAGA